MIERRHARQKLQSLEYVEIGRAGDGNGGFLLDLSEDGAAVQMAHPAPLDDEIELRFSLGTAGNVQARGRITWRDKAGKALGVCFTDLDNLTRVRITEWLAKNEGIPGYEWSVPSASTAGPPKQPPASSNQPVDSTGAMALDGPGSAGAIEVQTGEGRADGVPQPSMADALPGEARFISIALRLRPNHNSATPPAPVATEPTATFVPVFPVNCIAHRDPRASQTPEGRPRESPSCRATTHNSTPTGPLEYNCATANANTSGNRVASVRPDPLKLGSLDRKNRPASTPYFSVDDAADHSPNVVAPLRADNDMSAALAPPGKMGSANRRQPAGNRLLLRNVAVAGIPALIIVVVLAYLVAHPRLSSTPRTIASVSSPQSSQLSSATAPSNTGANGNAPSDAAQTVHSPYDEFSSLYPGPLGPGGAAPVAPSPYVTPPQFSKRSPGKQPATGAAAPSSSAFGLDSTAPGATNPLAGSQTGDREFSFGLQSLAGRGDTPGSTAAATYFWEAVTDGNVRAEVALAQLYLRGDGVPKDCDQAGELLNAAATRGNADALRILASLSSYGCEPPVGKHP